METFVNLNPDSDSVKKAIEERKLFDAKNEKIAQIKFVTSKSKLDILIEKIEVEMHHKFSFEYEIDRNDYNEYGYMAMIFNGMKGKEDSIKKFLDKFIFTIVLPYGFSVKFPLNIDISKSELKKMEEIFKKLNVDFEDDYIFLKSVGSVLENAKLKYEIFCSTTKFSPNREISLPIDYVERAINNVIRKLDMEQKFTIWGQDFTIKTKPTLASQFQYDRIAISFDLSYLDQNLKMVYSTMAFPSPFTQKFEEMIENVLVTLKNMNPNQEDLMEYLERTIPLKCKFLYIKD